MHKQPVYRDAPAYVNGVSEAIFKVGMCLPAGPYVKDEDVKYIVECIKELIEKWRISSERSRRMRKEVCRRAYLSDYKKDNSNG